MMSHTGNSSAMALDTKTESNSSNLNHVYFFLERNVADSATHPEPDSAVTTSSGESKGQHSRASSANDSIGTTTGTAASSTHSELNPLAEEFKPATPASAPSSSTHNIPPSPSASHVFELRKTEYSGLGLFATTFIRRGTLIICEEPLLKISQNALHQVWKPYCRLGNEQKAAFDALHGFQPARLDLEQASRAHLIDRRNNDLLNKEHIEEQVQDHVRVMGVFSVNNFELPPNGLAVYATASRLNHSCVPNVHHSYNPTLKSLTVFAVRDIYPNEELLTTYLGGPGAYQLRSQRKEVLHSSYGFICHCSACSDHTGTSDARRGLMAAITGGLMQFIQGSGVPDRFTPTTVPTALRMAEDLVGFMLEEGIVTIELTKAYRMASLQALNLKDFDKAFEYARNEAEVERNCLGTELKDLRKSKAAAECWTEQIYEAVRAEKGDAAVKAYREAAKMLKKKYVKNGYIYKKKAKGLSGEWKNEDGGNGVSGEGVVW